MKILIPAKKDGNTFFEEIICYSSNDFYYGDLTSNIDDFQYVLIQWVEQLFQWKEPSDEDLNFLKNKIEYWKVNDVKIIHVFHNEKRHYGMTFQFKKLYNLVLASVDVFIHFGDYSSDICKKKYPLARHEIIEHPLYVNSFKIKEKRDVRKQLKIKENTLVIIIPGTIRSLIERKMVLKNFKSLPQKNKLLIAPRMYYKKITYKQKGYRYLKRVPGLIKILERFSNNELNRMKLLVGEKIIPSNKLALLISASDIVWSPRIDVLNSGIVYLALTFNKVFVGPAVGNLTKLLDEFNMPKYNPVKSNSIKIALEKSVFIAKQNSNYFSEDKKGKYHPKKVAQKWDDLLLELITK